ncbi:MAG: DUF11 domain-containing protein [Bifidobacteriaceae bacterium]|jgi:uncharacterized repeat protein (TIGR01451 family)|nr:DUF11 domain-containing protein [Bifidobacteriaceae bacterium]
MTKANDILTPDYKLNPKHQQNTPHHSKNPSITLKTPKNQTTVFILAILAIIVSTLAFQTYKHQNTSDASLASDDSAGSHIFTFDTRAGVLDTGPNTQSGQYEYTNQIKISGGTATGHASYGGGWILLGDVRPASFSGWDHISIEGTWFSSYDVRIQLLTCDAVTTPSTNTVSGVLTDSMLLTQTVVPNNGTDQYKNNYNQGNNPINGRIDLTQFADLGLTPENYPCLRVKLNIMRSNLFPIISKVGVYVTPKTDFVIGATAPETIGFNQKIKYNIPYSVNYVNTDHAIVYMEDPHIGITGNPQDGPYGPVDPLIDGHQLSPHVEPSKVSVKKAECLEQGGSWKGGPDTETTSSATLCSLIEGTQKPIHTEIGLTIDGMVIPPNSIYWDLGAVNAGTSRDVSVTYDVPKNLLNNVTKIDAQAHIVASDGASRVTDHIITTAQVSPSPKLAAKLITPGLDLQNGDNITHLFKSIDGYSYNINTEIEFSSQQEPIFTGTTIKADIHDSIALLRTAECGALNDEQIAQKFTSNAPAEVLTKAINIEQGTYTFTYTGSTSSDFGLEYGFTSSTQKLTFRFNQDFSTCLEDMGKDLLENNINTKYSVDATSVTHQTKSKGNITVGQIQLNNIDEHGGMFYTGEGNAYGSDVPGGAGDDPYVNAQSTDDLRYGGTDYISLNLRNVGLVNLSNVNMLTAIPDGFKFDSAEIHLSGKTLGTIYYYTGDKANLETFEASELIQSSEWSQTVPSDPKTVTGVKYIINCVDSFMGPGNKVCDKPGYSNPAVFSSSTATGYIRIIADPAKSGCPSDIDPIFDDFTPYVCKDFYTQANPIYWYDGWGDLAGNTNTFTNQPKAHYYNPEPIVVKGDSVNIKNSINTPNSVTPGSELTIQYSTSNTGNSPTSPDSYIDIKLPIIKTVNGAKPVEFLGISGGNINTSDIETLENEQGNIDRVRIKNRVLPAKMKDTVNYTIKILIPRQLYLFGNETFSVDFYGASANGCNNKRTSNVVDIKPYIKTNYDIAQTLSRQESAILTNNVPNFDDSQIIDPYIHYRLTAESFGSAGTAGTYLVDKIPTETIFSEAITAGKDNIGTEYNCAGCKVYFASRNVIGNGMPDRLSTENIVTNGMINANFTIGEINSSADKTSWAPPVGMRAEDVGYIAYLVDDELIGFFPSGVNNSVGLIVKNDFDEDGAGELGSVTGSTIFNDSILISSETQMNVSTPVSTYVLSMPGLYLNKTSEVEYITAGEDITWDIEFRNDGSEVDDTVDIVDTFPAGVDLSNVKVYMKWNMTSNNEDSSLEMAKTLLDPSNYTINGQNITVHIAGPNSLQNPTGATDADSRKREKFYPREGGVLTFEVGTSSSIPSGTNLQNIAKGCYYSEFEDASFCIETSNTIGVRNPDLAITKIVDYYHSIIAHTGKLLKNEVTIENLGPVKAESVIIKDTLPAGVCYEAGSTIIGTTGWTIGEPVVNVQGLSCEVAPTLLIWNPGNGPLWVLNPIASPPNYMPGYFPGSDKHQTVRFSFGTTLKASNTTITGENLKLSDDITIQTSMIEDSYTNNSDHIDITPDTPDPYVTVTASDEIVEDGDNVTYSLAYGNKHDEYAKDVFIINQLPTGSNGKSTMIINSVTTNLDEEVHYVDASISATTGCNVGDISSTTNFSTFFAQCTNFKTNLADFGNPGEVSSYPTHIIITNVGEWTDTTDSNTVKRDSTLDYKIDYEPIQVVLQSRNPYTNGFNLAGTVYQNTATIYSGTRDIDYNNNYSYAKVKMPSFDLFVTIKADYEGASPGIAPGAEQHYTVSYGNLGNQRICNVSIADVLPTYYGTNDDGGDAFLPALNNVTTVFNKVDLKSTVTGLIEPLTDSQGVNLNDIIPAFNEQTRTWSFGQDVCIPAKSVGTFEITGTVDNYIPVHSPINYSATISQATGAEEPKTSNNKATSNVLVNLADLKVQISAVAAGKDGIFGDDDDSTTSAGPTEKVRWNLKYNNIGDLSADIPDMIQTLDKNLCFTPGSIEGIPLTAEVTYSNNHKITFNYKPSGSIDCSVTDFKVSFRTMYAPAAVSEAKTGEANFVKVAAGSQHTCGLTTQGKVYCWGDNTYGTLGIGTTNVPTATNSPSIPVVTGQQPGNSSDLEKITQIASGNNFSCALDASKNVYCWGYGTSGNLGNSSQVNYNTPQKVLGGEQGGVDLEDVTYITANGLNVCAIAGENSNVYCWGYNQYYQVGSNVYLNQVMTPVEVESGVNSADFGGSGFIEGAIDVSTGDTTCIIAGENRNVYCAGQVPYEWQSEKGPSSISYYAPGTSSPAALTTSFFYQSSAAPKKIFAGDQGHGRESVIDEYFSNAKAIKTTSNRICAIAGENNNTYCWGTGALNSTGGAPMCTTTKSSVYCSDDGASLGTDQNYLIGTSFVINKGTGGQTAFYSGNWVAPRPKLVKAGELYSDINNNLNNPTAAAASNLANTNLLTVGTYFSCSAVGIKNNVYCWGSDSSGQLGNGAKGNAANPNYINVPVINSTGGTPTDCLNGLNTSSTPYAEKLDLRNCKTNLGLPFKTVIGDQAAFEGGTQLTNVTDISAGTYHACAVSNGYIYCWGYNNKGQLGNLTNTNSEVPTSVYSSKGQFTYITSTTAELDIPTDMDLTSYKHIAITHKPDTGHSLMSAQLLSGTDCGFNEGNMEYACGLSESGLQAEAETSAEAGIQAQDAVIPAEAGTHTGLTAQDAPANTVSYWLRSNPVPGECSSTNPLIFPNPVYVAETDVASSFLVDISSLSTDIREFCITTTIEGDDSMMFTSDYSLSYDTPDDPYFTFDTTVFEKADSDQFSVETSVVTPTREVTLDNNYAAESMAIPITDLVLSQTYDKAVLVDTDIKAFSANSDTADITYTLTVNNAGSNAAEDVTINAMLADSTYFKEINSITSSSGDTGEIFTTNGGTHIDPLYTDSEVTFTALRPIAAGETITIEYIVRPVTNGLSGGALYTGSVSNYICVSTSTAETNYQNNCDTNITNYATSSALSNVSNPWSKININKTSLKVGDEITLTVQFGNNSLGIGGGWRLIIKLPDYVDFGYTNGEELVLDLPILDQVDDPCVYKSNINFNNYGLGQYLFCPNHGEDGARKASIPAGTSNTFNLTGTVAEDAVIGETVETKSFIDVASPQLTVDDDTDEASFTVMPTPGSISGYVFEEDELLSGMHILRSGTTGDESRTKRGAAGVTVELYSTGSLVESGLAAAGLDSGPTGFGLDAVIPASNSGVIPASGQTQAGLVGQSVMTTVTDSNGRYAFTGLNADEYAVRIVPKNTNSDEGSITSQAETVAYDVAGSRAGVNLKITSPLHAVTDALTSPLGVGSVNDEIVQSAYSEDNFVAEFVRTVADFASTVTNKVLSALDLTTLDSVPENEIHSIILGNGVDSVENNFGVLPMGQIGNFVWEDVNKNGVYDVSYEDDETPEMGLADVVIGACVPGSNCEGANLLGSATTDESGHYSFADLHLDHLTLSRDYMIKVLSLPARDGLMAVSTAGGLVDEEAEGEGLAVQAENVADAKNADGYPVQLTAKSSQDISANFAFVYVPIPPVIPAEPAFPGFPGFPDFNEILSATGIAALPILFILMLLVLGGVIRVKTGLHAAGASASGSESAHAGAASACHSRENGNLAGAANAGSESAHAGAHTRLSHKFSGLQGLHRRLTHKK